MGGGCCPIDSFLFCVDDIPLWQRDNDFITHGYRRSKTLKDALRSVFKIHNETGNIWSHIFGALLFASIALFCFSTWHFAYVSEQVILALFFLGAVLCFSASTFFHICLGVSREMVLLSGKLDYVCIVNFIASAYLAISYYNFFDNFVWFYVYGLFFAVSYIFLIATIFSPKFDLPRYRTFRGILFFLFGFQMCVPVLHTSLFSSIMSLKALGFLFLETMSFVLGVSLYANLIPERYWPGRFNVWGHSHQILHCLVVSGAVFHFLAIKEWHFLIY